MGHPFILPRTGLILITDCIADKPEIEIWIIPFSILKIDFEPLGSNGKHFEKKFFDQRPGIGRYDSISCLDDSISCFENQF